jgi:hypothetical protein
VNTKNSGVYFYPTPLEIFHPSLRNKGSKTMVTSFLLKKRTNPTPYSPISYFEKENNPSTHQAHSSFLMKLLKAPNNLTALE